MCTNPSDFWDKNDSFLYARSHIISRLQSWKEKDMDNKNINFTGGEPTIHPEFLTLAKEVRMLFPDNKIVMATNGRMFSYPSFTRKYLSLDNLSLEIAIHGSTPFLHDSITRVKGSFNQTINGVKNILKYRKPDQELELRIIITRLTYKKIDDIVKFIKNEFPKIDRVVFIFMEMEGLAGKNLRLVGLSYEEFKPQLFKFKKWAKQLPEIRLYHFPLCVLPSELWSYAWRTLREDEVSFLSRCQKCLYQKYCLGIHKDYLKFFGKKEFKPIKKKIKIQERENFYNPIIKVKI